MTLAKINACRRTIRRIYTQFGSRSASRKRKGEGERERETEKKTDEGGVLTSGCCLPCSNVDRTPSIVLAPYPAFKRISRSLWRAFICVVDQLNASLPASRLLKLVLNFFAIGNLMK